MPADLEDDRANLVLSESLQNHSSLMHGTRANEQSAHNIGRHSSIRKFDKEDAIEAAAVETILRIV